MKFELVKFNNDSSFWEKNGSRIKSIDLVNCHFPCGTLERIIIHCPNLIHFSLKYTVDFSMSYTSSESMINENDLDQVLEQGIVRDNLESLKIHVECIKINNSLLILIDPCIFSSVLHVQGFVWCVLASIINGGKNFVCFLFLKWLGQNEIIG